MLRTRTRAMLSATLVALLGPATIEAQTVPAKPPGSVRFATFNASLNRDKAGALARDLANGENLQARNVAEIIQRVRPDVLLINEFDYDPDALELFQKNYLGVAQNGAEPIVYPARYSAEVNTGVASGVDLDNDGHVVKEPGARGYGNDAFGFGHFPGQFGMAVYSMFPIDRAGVRQFHEVLWKDMPGALLPMKPDRSPWYSAEALAVFRLSSKGHWDVPVTIGEKVVHILASHPTPPAFDGPEKRNARRNHDEIRLWADYLDGPPKSDYMRASQSGNAALGPPDSFVIMGDLNADPLDGGSLSGAIGLLLQHPKVNPLPAPKSQGALEAAIRQGGINAKHRGDPALDTADFNDDSVGNLRVDYVLPSKDLTVLGNGVFWPVSTEPLARLVTMSPVASSDHRLVFLDVKRP